MRRCRTGLYSRHYAVHRVAAGVLAHAGDGPSRVQATFVAGFGRGCRPRTCSLSFVHFGACRPLAVKAMPCGRRGPFPHLPRLRLVQAGDSPLARRRPVTAERPLIAA